VAVQKWGLGIVGCTSTRTLAETLQSTSGVASYRLQLVWFNECPRPCYELAAAFGALRTLRRGNQSLDDLTLPFFTPAVDETKWPNSAEIEAALQSGLTPIRSLRDGTVEVVRSIIAKTQASVPYYIDTNPIEISDYVDEYLLRLFRERVKGRPLKVGSEPGSPSTITPTRATAILNEALFKLDKADYIQGVQSAIDQGLNFSEVNAVDPNRLDTAFRYWPIAFAHFCALKKTYVTSEG
jgi:phage tail sheath gpL-like